MPKVSPAKTTAAMMGCAQSAAAAMGVLAVWSADSPIDIPQAEQVGVGIVTILVALGLGLGCAQTLTGQSSRLLALANVGSLVISAYWGLLRTPAAASPVIPVAYAVLPMLGLGLLTFSAIRARTRGGPDEAADDV